MWQVYLSPQIFSFAFCFTRLSRPDFLVSRALSLLSLWHNNTQITRQISFWCSVSQSLNQTIITIINLLSLSLSLSLLQQTSLKNSHFEILYVAHNHLNDHSYNKCHFWKSQTWKSPRHLYLISLSLSLSLRIIQTFETLEIPVIFSLRHSKQQPTKWPSLRYKLKLMCFTCLYSIYTKL